MALQLGVSYMGGESEYVRIRRWPFNIGRNPGNDLCLANSPLISRRHARVFKEEDGYRLVACGRNPTYLNGTRVDPDEPVEIGPGDCIELPDYHLEVRDTSHEDSLGATVNVEVVSTNTVIVRRVASAIGISSWTEGAIHAWLAAHRDREIWIRHHHVTLCLPAGIALDQLRRRLSLFDALIAHLDPQAIAIDLVDPTAAVAAE